MTGRWALGGVASAGVAFGGLGGFGLLIARRLTAPVSGRRYDLTIRGVDDSGERPVVVLDRMPRTAATGVYCLIAENGSRYLLSRKVEDRGPGLVGREILGVSDGLAVGQRAAWSGILFSSPTDAGLPATDADVPTDVGDAPAWIIPSGSDPSPIWAIHIHGLGSMRAGTLRGVQVASDAGLTSLVVTYRNDSEGPVVGNRRLALGAAEVQDVRAAVDFARQRGARRVVLFGWSMGAAIALQLAAEPKLKGIVGGLVLESPVLDWVSTIKANCARAGLPAWTGTLALPWLNLRPLAYLTGLSNPVGLRRFDWIARADEITAPVLILHGTADTSSPFAVTEHLRQLRPDVVTVEPFDADHTMTWNSEPERWRNAVATWLRGVS